MAMTRSELLDRAKRLVVGDREKSYGSPEDNFARIGKMWNAFLGKRLKTQLTSVDVSAMMALLKLARIGSGTYSEDNWVDLAGYAACGGELASYETDEEEEEEKDHGQ